MFYYFYVSNTRIFIKNKIHSISINFLIKKFSNSQLLPQF